MVQLSILLSGFVAVASLAAAVPTVSKPLLEGLPLGSANGIYVGNLRDDGSTEWTYHGEVNNTAAAVSADKLAARQSPSGTVTCNGFSINRNDAANAINDFANLCGGGHFYNGISLQIVRGSAVAFGCNYGSDGQTCHSTDVLTFQNNINLNCGLGSVTGAGWFSIPQWKATYGRTAVGAGVC